MSVYVYRITAKKVLCSDGKEANVAIFAYKPRFSFGIDNENRKMHFSSGCVASERLAKLGKICDRFVFGTKDGDYDTEHVHENKNKRPYFYDTDVGNLIEGMTVKA